jgi:lipopolysaccharide transport system permease protein/teichoic acid transport system permease protein
VLKSFYYFLRLLFVQRGLILSLARREFTSQYVGSLLGFLWKLIQPLMMITVFWVVFSLGFKVQPQNNVPFVVWFTAGLAAWFFFAEIVDGSVWLVVSNASIIKKTVFHSQILPLVKITACLISHGLFVVVLLVLIAFHGLPFSFYYLQSLYYLGCLVVLALGISWIVSALNVFIRDVGQIVGVLLQIGFWATPIFWDYRMMPPGVQTAVKLNPMFYIVQGYRESFVFFSPFWQHPYQTIYFWAVAGAAFIGGALVFKRLKPHFADAL